MMCKSGNAPERLLAALMTLVAVAMLPLLGAPVAAAKPTGAPMVACPSAPSGTARCLAETIGGGTSAPTGLSPDQIKAAYDWPPARTAGAGETIAIVDAHDDPSAEADLAAFDAQFGLPSCTTDNGCFTKVDSAGGTKYPSFDSNWAFEISIDIQWAHAVAPGAKILLVEAQSQSIDHLLAAEDYAKAHAQYVSNSWIGNEFSTEAKDDVHFMQPGVSFFAGSGDYVADSIPTGYPAVSPDVVAVGGTQLNYDTSGALLSETGWSDGGGGCSAYETAVAAQSSFPYYPQVGCEGSRATPDLAADASCASPVSIYDSNPFGGQAGNWFAACGTSVATPLIAARSADAGILVDASLIYSDAITYRQIREGGNGNPCLPGYNLCAGLGSWVGTKP